MGILTEDSKGIHLVLVWQCSSLTENWTVPVICVLINERKLRAGLQKQLEHEKNNTGDRFMEFSLIGLSNNVM